MKASDGLEIKTGQFFGFGRLVQSVFKANTDTHLIFCQDSKDNGRQELHPEYKEGRPSSEGVYSGTALIEQLVTLHPAVFCAMVEGKEADDLLAQLAIEGIGKYNEIIVYSGDNDMLQLMPLGIKVSKKFYRGDFLPVEEDYVMETYGVNSAHLLAYRILTGDVSDRIPAVVPRLNREFAKEFAKVWTETNLEEAFRQFFGNPHAIKVKDAISVLQRNAKLMSLIKYKKPENRVEIKLRGKSGGQELLDKYELNGYKTFLTNAGLI